MTYLIICTKCNWACEMRVDGNYHEWRCPNCKEVRMESFTMGKLDLDAIREGAYALEAEGNDFEIFTLE